MIELIKSLRIVPVVAISDASKADGLASALVAGGLPIAEITLRTPASLEALKIAASNKDLLVGVGSLRTGEDLKKGQNAFFVNAENGDVIIRARNGKVRIEGLDVEISATGNNPEGTFWVKANDAVKIDAKNITLDAKQGLKLLTTGLLTLDGKLGMQILSPIVKGASCATDPAKKPGKIR